MSEQILLQGKFLGIEPSLVSAGAHPPPNEELLAGRSHGLPPISEGLPRALLPELGLAPLLLGTRAECFEGGWAGECGGRGGGGGGKPHGASILQPTARAHYTRPPRGAQRGWQNRREHAGTGRPRTG